MAILFLLAFAATTNAQIVFTCAFGSQQVDAFQGYTCMLVNIQVTGGSSGFSIVGEHDPGFGHVNVTQLDVQVTTETFYNELFEAFVNLEVVQIYRTGMRVIDPSHFYDAHKLRVLHVAYANLETIPRGVFNYARDLEVLRFVSCGLTSIEDRAFFGLSSLRELSLYDNRITFLQSDTLNTLTNLRVFITSFNQIERIDGSLFASNQRLENIEFQRNAINRIQSNFLNSMLGLKTLILQGNTCVNENFNVATSSSLSVIHTALRTCYENEENNVTPPTAPTKLPEDTTTPITNTQATTTTTTTERPPAEVITLNCTFTWIGSDYSCIISDVVITNDNAYFYFDGVHFGGWFNSDVRTVRIINSNVPFIIASMFEEFVNLENLELLTSQLTRIRDTDFLNAQRLRRINIQNGQIRSLEANAFGPLENLEELRINSLVLADIHENAFMGLQRLTKLELYSWQLEVLRPNTLSPLQELTQFSLTGTRVSRIYSNTFANNTKLRSIDLNFNRIIEIGADFIDHIPGLTSLELSSNLCADAAFGPNARFEMSRFWVDYELKHCYNNVGSSNPISPEFVELPCNYQWADNEYSCLLSNQYIWNEQAIFRMVGIHFAGWDNSDVAMFRMSSSNVSFVISRAFEVFPNLRHFQLLNTDLMQIRESDFNSATSLRSIRINGASSTFQTLQRNSFNRLAGLEILELNNNNFVTIDQNAFFGLSNLRELNLQGNMIESFHVNTFLPLPQLRSISIERNRLTSIHRQIFENNEELNTINMGFNSIIEVQRGFIDHLTRLSNFVFSSNRCGDSSFGSGLMFVFDRENIDYELQHCYTNVGLQNPVVPEIIQFNCNFDWVDSDYTCSLTGVSASNDQAIIRIAGTHFGGWFNSDVRGVRIMNSNVTFIIARMFHAFPSMRRLFLFNTNLDRIRSFDFEDARTLTVLSIVQPSNNLQAFGPNIFERLTNLEVLEFTSGALTSFHANAFAGLTRLRTLDVNGNAIQGLTMETLRPLVNLENLDIRGNAIEKLDRYVFSNNTNLVTLNLDNNPILEVEDLFINHLTSLRSFSIRNNRCADSSFGANMRFNFDRELISYEMKQCYANFGSQNPILPHFVSVGCNFNWINSEYTCSVQTVIETGENAIFRIDGTHFTGWDHSDVVAVEINNAYNNFVIARLFTVFPSLRSYGQSFVSSNSLSRVQSSDFNYAQGLRSLRLEGNIPRINPDWFRQLTLLNTLTLSNCKVTEIVAGAFTGLSSLTELNLNHNEIRTLSANILQPLTALRDLKLDNNTLQSIGRETFTGNPRLESISLASNEIIEIQRGFIENLQDLRTLRLQDNRCAKANFDSGSLALDQDNLDNELQFCYSNVGSDNPIVPEVIAMNCNFMFVESDYTCNLADITASNEKSIIRIGGTHFGGWFNSDVRSVVINRSDIAFIVSRVFAVFPNLAMYQHLNGISRISSADFVNANRLTTLSLWGAEFLTLDDGVFQNLTSLTKLEITSSLLATVQPDAFIGLDLLQDLNLYNSYIRTLHQNTLAPLRNLRTFEIRGNFLSRIEANTFQNNLGLQSIDFRDNAIVAISRNFIDGLTNLRQLMLLNNNCVSVNFDNNALVEKNAVDQYLTTCYNAFN